MADTNGGAAVIMGHGKVASAAVEDNAVSDVGQEATARAHGVVVTGTGTHDWVPASVGVTDNELGALRSDPESDFDCVGDDGSRVDVNSNELTENEVTDADGDGIHLLEASSHNTVEENELKDGGNYDAHDESSGDGTAGTANTWEENECETANPEGLCGGD